MVRKELMLFAAATSLSFLMGTTSDASARARRAVCVEFWNLRNRSSQSGTVICPIFEDSYISRSNVTGSDYYFYVGASGHYCCAKNCSSPLGLVGELCSTDICTSGTGAKVVSPSVSQWSAAAADKHAYVKVYSSNVNYCEIRGFELTAP
jgi:hypothetical protein